MRELRRDGNVNAIMDLNKFNPETDRRFVQHSRAQHAELELADAAFYAKKQAIIWPTRIIDPVEIDDAGFDKPT